jgi:hypothetical protein
MKILFRAKLENSFVPLSLKTTQNLINIKAVLRIRIHKFLGLPDPDPLVKGMDPDPALDPNSDPSIIVQK